MSDMMNRVPPLSVRDHEMLPTLVRRDAARSPAVTGSRSVRGRSEDRLAVLTDALSQQGYSRVRMDSPPVVKSGSGAKGLIIDVWA
jgi:hypothetical protein